MSYIAHLKEYSKKFKEQSANVELYRIYYDSFINETINEIVGNHYIKLHDFLIGLIYKIDYCKYRDYYLRRLFNMSVKEPFSKFKLDFDNVEIGTISEIEEDFDLLKQYLEHTKLGEK